MEMSITRALAELKLLDKKIEKAIQGSNFVNVSVGKNAVKGFKTNEEFIEKAKSQFQSVQALMSRRQAIKSAIVQSNAVTVVTIGGKEMTVAEAIEQKTFIQYKQNLLHKINLEFNQAHDRAERENQNVKARLDDMLKVHFGKDNKAKETEVEAISNPYMETNQAKVVDPINAREIIEKLQKEIEDFLMEVDFSLSDSNTLTKIKIPE